MHINTHRKHGAECKGKHTMITQPPNTGRALRTMEERRGKRYRLAERRGWREAERELKIQVGLMQSCTDKGKLQHIKRCLRGRWGGSVNKGTGWASLADDLSWLLEATWCKERTTPPQVVLWLPQAHHCTQIYMCTHAHSCPWVHTLK